MTFAHVYRVSFYLMLLFATLTLNVDATDSKVAWLYPIGVAVACTAAFLTVDRDPRLGISQAFAYALLVVAASLCFLEFRAEENLVLGMAHFLVFLQVVKLFLPKRVSDDWLLFGLGVMQVLVGAVISQSDREGMMMLCWALLSLWVLGLFYLRRETVRARALPGTALAPAPLDEPYPGLLSSSFVVSSLQVMVTTLALGGVIFLLMPRNASSARAQGIESAGKHLTGFDDEVQLGQLGEILESDSLVMSVEFYDQNRARTAPAGDLLLWRGVTMEIYRDARWHRGSKMNQGATFPYIELPESHLRQVIKLEPTDSDVLFGLRPFYRAEALGSHVAPQFRRSDGTLLRAFVGNGRYDYLVISSTDPDAPQPRESIAPINDRMDLLEVPGEIAPRLKEIADAVLEREGNAPDKTLARTLEAYLRDNGGFGYTLRMQVVDATLDPVVDFLENRKEGHCEYFASALTLLLRSKGIPARMVNGFKGGDWSSIAQVMSVRQKHAHSWVEALVPGDSPHEWRWITLDPTPATARAQSVAAVGGLPSSFRQLSDLVRYVWVFYVVGFNSERQNALLYQPIRELLREARDGFAIMGRWLRDAFAEILSFRNPGQIISWRGLMVSFTSLLLLVLLFRASRWASRRLFAWLRGPERDRAGVPAGVLFYRRLAALLATFGLERPPAETQEEFARRAAVFLAARGDGQAPVADVPKRVVEAFYSVRFGQRALDARALERLETSLDTLEARLQEGRG